MLAEFDLAWYDSRVMTQKFPDSPIFAFSPRGAAFAAALALFPLTGPAAFAASFMDARTDAPPLSYAPGDTAVVSFRLSGDASAAPAWIHWSVRGALATPEPAPGSAGGGAAGAEAAPVPSDSGTALVGAGQALHLRVSRDEPGFAVASAFVATGPEAAPLRRDGRAVSATAAAGFGAGALRGIPEPEDFDEFWSRIRARAAAADISQTQVFPAPPADAALVPGFFARSFRVEIGGGVRPATGWIVVPKDAAQGSLPLELRFFDYGDGGSAPVAPAAAPEKGVLSVQVNVHGFELGRDRDYYKAYMARANDGGHGGGYGFHDAENSSPESSFYAGAILRCLVAARFAATLPEWNGLELEATGAGQGAWLAAAVAALDDDVTRLVVDAPWLCGLGGEAQQGRLPGWRPIYQPALRYFDGVNFAARVKVPCVVTAGLADSTCPPDSVAAFVNALRGQKSSRWTQNRAHSRGSASADAQEQAVEGELPGGR